MAARQWAVVAAMLIISVVSKNGAQSEREIVVAACRGCAFECCSCAGFENLSNKYAKKMATRPLEKFQCQKNESK